MDDLMQLSPQLRAFLERLGVNTTRLQWKLYQLEQKRQSKPTESYLPASLRWLKYGHKFCPECRALVHRGDAKCPHCGAKLPSMPVYRIMRLLGLMAPQGSAPTIVIFLFLIVSVYALTILMQGPSAIFRPSMTTTNIFGAWSPFFAILNHQYWRYLAFGLVHGGLMHILFNSVALMQVGPLIEVQTGRAKMLVVITVTQLTAAFATHWWYWSKHHALLAQTVGASGWLFGLIGYGIGYFHYVGGAGRQYRDFMVQWAIYGVLFGFLIGANNAAHIGGMVGGIALGLIPDQERNRERFFARIWRVAFWISVALWLVTLAMMGYTILANWTPGGGDI